MKNFFMMHGFARTFKALLRMSDSNASNISIYSKRMFDKNIFGYFRMVSDGFSDISFRIGFFGSDSDRISDRIG